MALISEHMENDDWYEDEFINEGFGFENDSESRKESIKKRERKRKIEPTWTKLKRSTKIIIPKNTSTAFGLLPSAILMSFIETDLKRINQDPDFFAIPKWDSTWTIERCPCIEEDFNNAINSLEEMEIISVARTKNSKDIMIKLHYKELNKCI